jgi:protein-disulfide isomerase
MEQKQLDEIDESYFGEEFIDDDEDVKVEKVNASPKKSKKVAKKTVSKKAARNKVSGGSKEPKKATKKEKEATVKVVEKKVEEKEVKTEISSEINDNDNKINDSKPWQEESKEDLKKDNPIDYSSEPKSEIKSTAPVDPWAEDDDNSSSGLFKEVSTWKAITGILVILLIFSVFTQGFEFSGDDTITGGATLSIAEAEQKALDFVNNNLLQAPFTAEVGSSEETANLYKVTLSVAGEVVDSYITKDGSLFFPQGFNVGESLTVPGSEEVAEIVEVSIDDDPMKGNKDASVTIIEFSEYQCPFCKKYIDETYSQIVENYVDTGKVNYVFRDFPLDFHDQAKPAAMAAECADEQGQFWEYHDLLFANQNKLSADNFKQWAEDLGLDTEQFNDCVDSEKYKSEVEKDLADGQSYGVQGTPGFFINGKVLSGAQPYSVFEQEIEAALAASSGVESEIVEEIEEVAEIIEEELSEPVVEEPVEEVEEVPVVMGNTVKLSVTAKKWLFSPQKFVVKQDDLVQLNVNPVGLDLTFAIPGLGVEQAVSGATTVEFTAGKKGSFEFKCSNCEDWRGMTGTLIVE